MVLACITSTSPAYTERVGYLLGSLLKPGMVVGLKGPLGAGKTCLVRGILKGSGLADHARSPTFTLINEYSGPLKIYHIDLYRLENPDEAVELEIEEILEEDGVCLIEWVDRIESVLPEERLIICITKAKGNGNVRQLHFEPNGARYEDLVRAFERSLKRDELLEPFT